MKENIENFCVEMIHNDHFKDEKELKEALIGYDDLHTIHDFIEETILESSSNTSKFLNIFPADMSKGSKKFLKSLGEAFDKTGEVMDKAKEKLHNMIHANIEDIKDKKHRDIVIDHVNRIEHHMFDENDITKIKKVVLTMIAQHAFLPFLTSDAENVKRLFLHKQVNIYVTANRSMASISNYIIKVGKKPHSFKEVNVIKEINKHIEQFELSVADYDKHFEEVKDLANAKHIQQELNRLDGVVKSKVMPITTDLNEIRELHWYLSMVDDKYNQHDQADTSGIDEMKDDDEEEVK